MTKKEFLYALEMKLSHHMSLQEVEKAIRYYDEYIEEGKEYQPEDKILEEIGDIDQLVEDLLHSLNEEEIDYTSQEIVMNDQAFHIDISLINFMIYIIHGDYKNIIVDVPPMVKQYFSINLDEHHLQITQIKRTAVIMSTISKHNNAIGGILKVYIPQNLILNEKVHIGHGLIDVKGNKQKIEKGEYITENGLITMKGMEGSIDLKAKNGKIKISDCEGKTLVCETENAEISFNNTNFCKGKLFTTNSPIHGKDSTFSHILEKTKNGYIKNKDVKMIEGILETTNGHIKVTGLEQSYHVLASTKNGMVQVDPRHTLFQTILGDQENYLSLKTTNGNIVVE